MSSLFRLIIMPEIDLKSSIMVSSISVLCGNTVLKSITQRKATWCRRKFSCHWLNQCVKRDVRRKCVHFCNALPRKTSIVLGNYADLGLEAL
jgi:hypothetical protein